MKENKSEHRNLCCFALLMHMSYEKKERETLAENEKHISHYQLIKSKWIARPSNNYCLKDVLPKRLILTPERISFVVK